MEAQGPFTKVLWDKVQLLYTQILQHPFIAGLADGSLSSNSFSHYLSQDVLYLKDDNCALEVLSERARDNEQQQFFKRLAVDGLEIEHVLHNEFLHHFQIVPATRKSPVIEAYTRFLLLHSEQSDYEVAVAALLPCFWVYNSVGHNILEKAVADNPYQKWIDTYKGDEYEEYTLDFIRITEKLAISTTSEKQEKMVQAFVEATQFELSFFEEAMANPGVGIG